MNIVKNTNNKFIFLRNKGITLDMYNYTKNILQESFNSIILRIFNNTVTSNICRGIFRCTKGFLLYLDKINANICCRIDYDEITHKIGIEIDMISITHKDDILFDVINTNENTKNSPIYYKYIPLNTNEKIYLDYIENQIFDIIFFLLDK